MSSPQGPEFRETIEKMNSMRERQRKLEELESLLRKLTKEISNAFLYGNVKLKGIDEIREILTAARNDIADALYALLGATVDVREMPYNEMIPLKSRIVNVVGIPSANDGLVAFSAMYDPEANIVTLMYAPRWDKR